MEREREYTKFEKRLLVVAPVVAGVVQIADALMGTEPRDPSHEPNIELAWGAFYFFLAFWAKRIERSENKL